MDERHFSSSVGDISLQRSKRRDRLGGHGNPQQESGFYDIQHRTEVFLHGPVRGVSIPPLQLVTARVRDARSVPSQGAGARPTSQSAGLPKSPPQCLRGKWEDSDSQRWPRGRASRCPGGTSHQSNRDLRSGPRLQCGRPPSCPRPLTRGLFPSCQQTT